MRHHPAHDLSRTYRCVSILLGRAALRADQHVHLLFPPVKCAKALSHMPPGNPAFTTLPKIGANPTLDRRTNRVSGPAPGETQRSLGGVGRIAGRLIISKEVEDETNLCNSVNLHCWLRTKIVLLPVAVPSPIVGAGLPGLVARGGGGSLPAARAVLKIDEGKKKRPAPAGPSVEKGSGKKQRARSPVLS